MDVAVIGISHVETPIEIREKVTFSESKTIQTLSALQGMGIEEVAILSTCNRSEIYLASDDIEDNITKVKSYMQEYFDVPLQDYLFHRSGRQCVDYLFHVTSGFDSMIIGEDQILGQVRQAMDIAMEYGGSKKILNKLLRDAITLAKKVHTKHMISETPLSLSSIGVKRCIEELGGVENRNIMLLGTGQMGTLALHHLVAAGAKNIYCVNREREILRKLQDQYPFIVEIPFAKRHEILSDMDVLVTATSATHHVIHRSELPILKKPLFIIDLALPRDVDPKVGELEMVQYLDIDRLKVSSDENKDIRLKRMAEAKSDVEEEVEHFMRWLPTVGADPILKALNQRILRIQNETLQKLYPKVNFSQKEKRLVEGMLYYSMRRLVREPILAVKDWDDEEKIATYVEMLEEMFRLS